MNTQKLKQLVNLPIKESSKTFYLHLVVMGSNKIGYSNKQLAKIINVTERTIANALAELDDIGLITRETHYRADNKSILGRTITLK